MEGIVDGGSGGVITGDVVRVSERGGTETVAASASRELET
jgi:hypothetical protein